MKRTPFSAVLTRPRHNSSRPPVRPAAVSAPVLRMQFAANKVSPRPDGFTLVELLTVITIITVLAAILTPSLLAMRSSARAAQCAANLRQLGAATLLMAAEDNGRFPGIGKGPGTATGWQTVMNMELFSKQTNTGHGTVQVHGDRPLPGLIYCPSIEPWGKGKRYPVAYARNKYVALTTDPPIGTYHGIPYYIPGKPMNNWDDPSRKILFLENEFDSETCSAISPFGKVAMNNSASYPPTSGNSGRFAFRHRNRMNVTFMDGHVEVYTPATFGPLNVDRSFMPR